ncbi:MAG: urease accessory protein UreD [Synechococcus sp. ELA057]
MANGSQQAQASQAEPANPAPAERPAVHGDGAANPGWHARASLRVEASRIEGQPCRHQAAAQAPLKWLRAFPEADGRLQIPLLHTAGGLVGGDQLQLDLKLEPGGRALLTSVAAQKVYGSVGRSALAPEGRWASLHMDVQLATGADLEWLPQELVLYADGLYAQQIHVELEPGASYLGAEVVRLGRSAAGESLRAGRFRSSLSIGRRDRDGLHWELVDRLELAAAALESEHGMASQPVFGSLVWAAPAPLDGIRLEGLLERCRDARRGLDGAMACGALEQGLIARYRGPSSQAARFWFTRLWALIRQEQTLPPPVLPRVWPFQEQPLADGWADGWADGSV